GDWRDRGTSSEGWEAARDVACQSEERAHVPLLPAVRQGVSRGCAGVRLSVLSRQRRHGGRGRPDVCGHRRGRGGGWAGGRGVGSTKKGGKVLRQTCG